MARVPFTRSYPATLRVSLAVVPVLVAVSGLGAVAAASVGSSGSQPAMSVVIQPSAGAGINREAKAPRLPLPVSRSGGEAIVETIPAAATSIVAKAAKIVKSPTRSNALPRGCLSALGALRTNSATEELTICVADAR
ncbi:hypothetical protein [Ancylobacter lacus]|uniref:hypothetical protein n=1 Tax=Ancylobacter lacus TaxID=2579970 RepID=UPI001BCA803D|nr:hypothetical protein [Ancylobacter lacus]MBS7541040.1 hypothetical protein [Ancylobacter lacus]